MSSVNYFRYPIRIAVVILLLLTCGIGCDDKPTNPAAAKDYIVYFADEINNTMIYEYHPATGHVDSFSLPYRTYAGLGFAISADGKYLYMPTLSSIAVISMASHAVISEHAVDAAGEIAVSPDGRYLAWMRRGPPVKKLIIIKTSDFSTVYQDTTYATRGVFSGDGNQFYCAAVDSDGYVYALKIDLANSFTLTKRYFASDVSRIIPSKDGARWFVKTSNDLEVYDMARDSTIFRRGASVTGDMEITPDGRYLIYTEPGVLSGFIPAAEYFTIYDINHNTIYRLVTPWEYPDPLFYYMGEIVITPDGKWLVGLPPFGGGGKLFAYSLVSLRFERYTLAGSATYPFSLVCQSAR